MNIYQYITACFQNIKLNLRTTQLTLSLPISDVYVVSSTQYNRRSSNAAGDNGAVQLIVFDAELKLIQFGKLLPSDWLSTGAETSVETDQELLIMYVLVDPGLTEFIVIEFKMYE